MIQKCFEISHRHLVKYVEYNLLEGSWRVTQPEWHPIVRIDPIFDDKRCLQFVFLCYRDLIVTGEPVHKGVNFMSGDLLQDVVCKWNQEGILDHDCIKASKIYAYPDLGGVFLQ